MAVHPSPRKVWSRVHLALTSSYQKKVLGSQEVTVTAGLITDDRISYRSLWLVGSSRWSKP
jgi:hypothetical protein